MSDQQNKISVLLETEGTYPYAGGGVSTWCHILTQELGDIDFYIFALTGEPKWNLKFSLPANVKAVQQIPMWGAIEPSEYTHVDEVFANSYERKKRITQDVIKYRFLPLFKKFINGILHPEEDIYTQSQNLKRLYDYFKVYDYKATFQAEDVWNTFREIIYREFSQNSTGQELPSLYDVTTAMRWIYHYFMPLGAKIPKTDISHSTIAGFSGLAGCISKLEYGTPFLVTDHGVYIRERYFAISVADLSFFAKQFLIKMSAFVTRLVYYLADQVSPVANFNKRWESRFGVAPDKFKTIYNGIDPQVFTPGEKPEELKGKPIVVAAAHIIPLKDIETMIRACNIVREKIPGVRFIVYGSKDVDPVYTKKCQNLIEKLQLQENFVLAGYHNNPAKIYNEGDLTVLSSISEGFPYTVIESMACARPVVATDVGGVREALDGYGILVKPRDAVEFAQGVITLLEDVELRQHLGTRGREQVLLKYRISSSVEEYLDSYKRLVQKAYQKTEAVPSNIGSDEISYQQVVDMWREVL